MYTLSFPGREVGFQGGWIDFDKLCMSVTEYLSDCDAKLNLGEICNMCVCTDPPSCIWVEKELMTFAKLSLACCIVLRTKTICPPPP